MENRNSNQNNGVEAADKSSRSTCGFEPPDNSSYQEWLYIAAIARQLNRTGLVGPVKHCFCGKECTYDFFQPEDKALFKVFNRTNLEEYRNFPECLEKPIAIIDVCDYDCRILPTNCFYGRVMSVDKKIGQWLSKRKDVYLFHDRELWEFQQYSSEGLWIWHSVVPPLYGQGFEDACGREDDDETEGYDQDDDDEEGDED